MSDKTKLIDQQEGFSSAPPMEDVSLNDNQFQPEEVFGNNYDVPQTTQPQDNLQFQNFEHSSNFQNDFYDNNNIDSGGKQGLPSEGFVDQPNQTEAQMKSQSAHFWSINYYRPLCDVDTNQVLTRMLAAVTPMPNKNFFDTISPNPDVYGPFWVVTTLIFMTAATGNFGNMIKYAASNGTSEGWNYNFNMVSIAAAVIYGYTFGIPLLLWLLFKYTQVPLKLLEVICLYGYAMLPFIAASVVCVADISWLQWAIVFIAVSLSAVFILLNLFSILKVNHLKRSFVILPVVAALHVGLGFTFKLYFFNYMEYNNLELTSTASGSTTP